jgi:hypothetical protein
LRRELLLQRQRAALLVLAAIIAWPEIPLLLPRLISPEFLR